MTRKDVLKMRDLLIEAITEKGGEVIDEDETANGDGTFVFGIPDLDNRNAMVAVVVTVSPVPGTTEPDR